MKVSRLTKAILGKRRLRKRFEPSQRQKLKDKIDLLKQQLETASRELRNSNYRIDSLHREIRGLEHQLRAAREVQSFHWVLIIEQPGHNLIYHFEGPDAEHLARLAFANNTQPRRVVLMANVTAHNGDYKDAGKSIVVGEIMRNPGRSPLELPDSMPKLIELK
jgi:septal ring factor EnvC (AmiA/AmiB activator)